VNPPGLEPLSSVYTAALFAPLHREAWRVYRGEPERPAVRVRVESDQVWRLFYNALSLPRAREVVAIEGDTALAEPLLRARSVMV